MIEIKKYEIKEECKEIEAFLPYFLEAIEKAVRKGVETGFSICKTDNLLYKEPADCRFVECNPKEEVISMHGYYCGNETNVIIPYCKEKDYATMHVHVKENTDRFSVFDIASAIERGLEATCVCSPTDSGKSCKCVKINTKHPEFDDLRKRISKIYLEAAVKEREIKEKMEKGEISISDAAIEINMLKEETKLRLMNEIYEAGERGILPKNEWKIRLIPGGVWEYIEFEDYCVDVELETK